MLPYFNLHKSIDEGIFSHFEKDTVAEPSIEYMRQIVIRTLIRDLLGGTQTMQAAEQRWLPRNPKEKWNSYTRRLQSSILYSAFKNTVEKITSKPFSRPIIVPTIGNEQIDLIQTDADFEGTDLSPFVWDVFWDGVAYGQSHIFVDYPKVSKTINLQVQRQNKIHPYFVRIPALSLIGRRESGGQLTQIRIMTMETVEDGRFGEKEVPQVVVWNADGTWEKWRKNANGAWVVEEEGTHTFKGIPLYTFYTSRKGVLKASPPLEDLAWVNLGHWQSYSDQRNILRML